MSNDVIIVAVGFHCLNIDTKSRVHFYEKKKTHFKLKQTRIENGNLDIGIHR